MKSRMEMFTERCEQFDIYQWIISLFKIDEKIRNKWDYPDIPLTKKIERWKKKYPEKYKGFCDDIEKLTLALNLPQDRTDMIGTYIGRRVIPIHGNRIITKFEINKDTGEKELWIKINKTTSINNVRDVWKNTIKPKQQQLSDRLINPDNFWLDEKIFKFRSKGYSHNKITKLLKKESSLTVETINNACYRYKKMMNLGKKIFDMF